MNKVTSARPANRFERGSAMYACGCCGRNTRSTGRGDNELVKMCAECYDLGGEENSLSDSGKFYGSPEEILGLIKFVGNNGGDASKWDDLKTEAEKQIATKNMTLEEAGAMAVEYKAEKAEREAAAVATTLILKPAEASAIWVAMAHLNDVGGRIATMINFNKEDERACVEDAEGRVIVTSCYGLKRERYADQAAFAKAYGL